MQVDWSQERYNEIKEKLAVFFKQVSFNAKNITYIPLSGITGENLNARKEPKLSWYTGPTLVEAIGNTFLLKPRVMSNMCIDAFKPATRLVDQPFRLCIADVYRNISLGNAVGGKVEAGVVATTDKVRLLPADINADPVRY